MLSVTRPVHLSFCLSLVSLGRVLILASLCFQRKELSASTMEVDESYLIRHGSVECLLNLRVFFIVAVGNAVGFCVFFVFRL